MSMRIITGATGTAHVTSNNDGEFNQALFGAGLRVFNLGGKLAATIVDNNTISIADGDLLLDGRHALIEPNTTETVTIETGAVSVNRNDLIVAHYELDNSTGFESLDLKVIKGTETSGAATDPDYTKGDIRTGSTICEAPLYRVRIEGVSIKSIDTMYTLVEQTITSAAESIKELSADIAAIHTDHDFTISTSWNANTTYGDCSTYPYYQTIASDLFTDESHPDCLVFGADPSAFMTSDEDSAKGLMCGEVSFSTSGIIVLAMSATETPLTLRVRGV